MRGSRDSLKQWKADLQAIRGKGRKKT
ncbi:Protein of unknown function [Bacillus mycoides]|nr:Protein of unknown function [Bacillus mycoides]